MGKVRIAGFSVSLDGYGAGVAQSLDEPLGRRGEDLHTWMVGTRRFREMLGEDGGSEGVDNDFAAGALDGFGAHIMGRNMFGPVRGPWPGDTWRGWWGETPPYRTPVFVLTHHPRAALEMEGGTVFHFVTGGLGEAFERAKAVAGDADIKIDGGVSTLRQTLAAGIVDEIHLAVSPVFLGRGEALFEGLNLPGLGFAASDRVVTDHATHVVLTKQETRP